VYPDVNGFLPLFANPGEHDIKCLLLDVVTTTSLHPGLAAAPDRDGVEGRPRFFL